MRISFQLNRDEIHANVRMNQTALDFLREDRGLTGAKEACNEGDCGACVIAVGDLDGTCLRYRAMNSCLLPAARLHGKHVVTVEGLAGNGALHPVQQAMVENHAVQCGFCTSGFVMSLFCLFLANPTPTPDEIACSLDGSLCRCTGYASILKAANSLSDRCRTDPQLARAIRPVYFDAVTAQVRRFRAATPVPQTESSPFESYHAPQSLRELFGLMDSLSDSSPTLVSGGTDVMVPVNLGKVAPACVVDLGFLHDLAVVEERDSHVAIGARATLTDLLESRLVQRRFAALIEAVTQMCSTPIRNIATLAGNLCTASPIADTIPPLLAYDARVVLESENGARRIPLRDFFRGYRQTALTPGELLTAVEIPFSDYLSSFEKTGKRKTLDIASVNSALAIRLVNGQLTDARLAYGGVAAMPFIAERTAAFLRGKPLSPDVVLEAAKIVATEIAPIDDVRGSADFRRELAGNHLIKHFIKLIPSLFK